MSRTVKKKKKKFKLLYFPNKVGYRAGNMQADISQNAFYPMKKIRQVIRYALKASACKLIQLSFQTAKNSIYY